MTLGRYIDAVVGARSRCGPAILSYCVANKGNNQYGYSSSYRPSHPVSRSATVDLWMPRGRWFSWSRKR